MLSRRVFGLALLVTIPLFILPAASAEAVATAIYAKKDGVDRAETSVPDEITAGEGSEVVFRVPGKAGSGVKGKMSVAPPEVAGSRSGEGGGKNIRRGILDGVAIRESGKRGLISFTTNGAVPYDVITSAEPYRKWITIVMPEVTSDLPDLPSDRGEIIGEICVQDHGATGGVMVSVEVLPVKVGYELFQEGDSLILEVTVQ